MPTPLIFAPAPGRGLLVISPGVGQQHSEGLYRAACLLANSGVRRLLLREPSLDAATVERLARRLLSAYPRDGLVLHEKCAGAREVAASLGLGLHLTGSADWAAERARTNCPLGASAHSADEVRHAAAIGLQWAFLSPVFQPTSKPLDTRPHLGEGATVAAQRESPTLVLHALGGISPEAAARLTRSGVGGVCVLGGVWTVRPDGSVDADTASASKYIAAVESATRLRGGGWRNTGRVGTPRACASRGSAGSGVSGAVGNLHGGKYQFGPGGAASAVCGEFAAALASGGSPVGGGDRGSAEAWRKLNPTLALADELGEDAPLPKWRRAMGPNPRRMGATVQLEYAVPRFVERAGSTVAVVRVTNSMRTWEPFAAAVVDRHGTLLAPLVRAAPDVGTLAPRGGANNACDERKPYPDWVDVSVVVLPQGSGAGSLTATLAEAHNQGARAEEASADGEGDAASGLFLVVKTEEEQWSFPLAWAAEL